MTTLHITEAKVEVENKIMDLVDRINRRPRNVVLLDIAEETGISVHWIRELMQCKYHDIKLSNYKVLDQWCKARNL